jgi:hypothetical protein
MKRHIQHILFLLAGTLLLASCHSAKQAGSGQTSTANESAYKQRVISNSQTAGAITAKIKAHASMGTQGVTLGGSLRMKRNDVIQLSLTFMGLMEVGRLEFTRDNVLFIDRIHQRYARVSYSQIDFLSAADLDFYALQAIFWNEIFVPGSPDIAQVLSRFTLASSGDHTLLSLTSAPKLDYAFLTQTKTAQLTRTSVHSKNVSNADNLECIYGNFVKLGGKSFPTTLNVKFNSRKPLSLDLTLSSLNNASDWTTRTSVSSKYKEMDANKLLENIMNQ